MREMWQAVTEAKPVKQAGRQPDIEPAIQKDRHSQNSRQPLKYYDTNKPTIQTINQITSQLT